LLQETLQFQETLRENNGLGALFQYYTLIL
jgi:hypothetical protein